MELEDFAILDDNADGPRIRSAWVTGSCRSFQAPGLWLAAAVARTRFKPPRLAY